MTRDSGPAVGQSEWAGRSTPNELLDNRNGLVAFLVVSIAMIILRRRQPDLPRTFKVPGYPVVPILSPLGCLWTIKDLRAITLSVFVTWVAVALVWHFAYGIKHSHLGRHEHVGLIKDIKED